MPSGRYDSLKQDTKLEAVLKAHVVKLSDEIPGKSKSSYFRLKTSAEYIKAEFKKAGYVPESQKYDISSMHFENVFVTKKGSTNRLLIIGAHYDTYFNPGADDNLSGVAVMLETAKLAVKMNTNDTIIFVAFANEEPPNFKTDTMGSYVFAKALKERKSEVAGAVILESVGYYSDKPVSQTYPPLFGFFYPNKGNFIALVSNFSSRKLAGTLESSFKDSPLPLKKAITFDFVPGVDFSDNWGFWKEGYPAVLLTDTAFFRNPNYHTSKDVYDTLDYGKMADIVKALKTFLEKS
ncbi:MAG: hypothetical protein A2231_09670 [Candidatus Firestonebacteria bacterium RIFOXYA2_FULL_40_8]|nr:MAG: hypothetical protein A2231_09670 [Candidatus Firestonebacteria bacterium RIFOXYA2_FULL_40_8]